MSARVALLILVTALFAALWSGDHPDQIATIDQPAEKRSHYYDDETPGITNQPASERDSASLSSTGSQRIAPLPEGISAGTYLVADQYGRTIVRVVSAEDAVSVRKTCEVADCNHYSVKLGQNRWHYILLEQVPIGQLTDLPSGTPVYR